MWNNSNLMLDECNIAQASSSCKKLLINFYRELMASLKTMTALRSFLENLIVYISIPPVFGAEVGLYHSLL